MRFTATPLWTLLSLCAISTLAVGPTFAQAQPPPANKYEPGPDSKTQPDVPKGEVIRFSFEKSKIFPGTVRDVWVYVPAQYTPDKPACLYVNQDGVQWNAPTVFDNLIAKKEMPITIGVFVMHGRVKAADGKTALDRFNRSYEYDGLGDDYVRFVLDELLPEVETRKTADGRAIRISKDGNDHAIGGSSSGAVCAFTAAWERPDAFPRVFSAIGTYVGLRGADRYPTLIRKYEPKPLRVFLQDGSNDQNIYAGDWWFANQMMERALTFSGYEVNHAWGDLGHDGRQGTQVFPDAMRWLWKDWPQPIKVGQSKNRMLTEILAPEENWQVVGQGYKQTSGLAVDPKGTVFFSDLPNGKAYQIGADGKAGDAPKERNAVSLAFGADGKPYNYFKKGVRGDIVVANNGNLYATEPSTGGKDAGKVWLQTPSGQKKTVDTGLNAPGGLTLSPDQTLLYVNDSRSHWVYSYQIQADGTLIAKQRYYWLHSPDRDEDSGEGIIDGSGAGGMCVDHEGRLYVASRLGIQVCDQPGRVNCILPVPTGQATAVCIGGANLDTLFVTTSDRVYRRKLKTTGSPAWQAPHRPNVPGL